MTANRDPDARYDSWPQALRFVQRQWLKRVHTALPGVIVEYDAETRRARVQPAVDLMMTDGQEMPRAVVLDVPVLWPSVGGWLIHMPLVAGDTVMLVYAERDIDAVKITGTRGPPPSGRVLAEQDAVALPVLMGPTPVTPVTSTGIVMQAADGETYVEIVDGSVRIHADNIRLEYDGGTEEWP